MLTALTPCVLSTSPRWRSSLNVLITSLLGLTLIFGCASNEDGLMMEPLDDSTSLSDVDINRPSTTFDDPVGALIVNGSLTGNAVCSVVMISNTHGVTAAHCLTVGTAPTAYQVSFESPVIVSNGGATVLAVYVHPQWTGNVAPAIEHIQNVQRSEPSSLQSTPWYDLAVIQLVEPIPDGVRYGLSALPSGGLLSINGDYFQSGANGITRASEAISVSHITSSTFTVLTSSIISQSGGGAGGIVSVANVNGSNDSLVGVLSMGLSGAGALFTRLDAHSRFIQDAMIGSLSGLYEIETTNPNNPDNPNNPNIPDDPNMPPFDCTQTSDGFCDVSCVGDIDCGSNMTMMSRGAPLGAPCLEGEDCDSFFCLELNPMRSICSEFCGPNALCPTIGFECVMDTSGRGVCAPIVNEGPAPSGPDELLLFGATCMNDAQCTTRACIEHGGRRWCSQRCMESSDCPVSYQCTAVTGGRACTP